MVRWVTERKKESVIQPRDTCTNTGKPLLDVLQSKHPEVRAPWDIILDAYLSRLTELIPVNLTKDTVIEVAWRLLVGAEPGREPTLFTCNIVCSDLLRQEIN